MIHWVSASDSVETDINLYDRLFNHESPDSDKEGDFLDHLNPPESLVVLKGARVEKSLAQPPVPICRTSSSARDTFSATRN